MVSLHSLIISKKYPIANICLQPDTFSFAITDYNKFMRRLQEKLLHFDCFCKYLVILYNTKRSLIHHPSLGMVYKTAFPHKVILNCISYCEDYFAISIRTNALRSANSALATSIDSVLFAKRSSARAFAA